MKYGLSTWKLIVLIFLLFLWLGCSGSSRYIRTDQIDDLTPGISDTDIKLLIDEII